MKSKIKYITIAIAVIAVVVSIIAYQLYHKPHPDYLSMQPDVTVTAQELFDAFITDQAAASESFNGKLLLITGSPSAVETVDSLVIAVYALGEGMFGEEGIRCTFHSEVATMITQSEPSAISAIKGYCTGYNGTDVILEKCSLVKNN